MKSKSRDWMLLTLLAAAVMLALLWPFLFFHVIPLTPFKDSNIGVGESYEVLTAVFTLGAFVLVLRTLELQRQDLERQREESLVQRRMAQVDGARGEFFQLLGAWQEIVRNSSFESVIGRQAFHRLSAKLTKMLRKEKRTPLSESDIRAIYEAFYRDDAGEPLGHYFRLLYNILKFVHEENDLDSGEKLKLIRLVRAHLSEPELTLLFWSGLSGHGTKFKPLIDEYDLLQNFLFEGVMEEEVGLYPKTRERRQKMQR